MNATWIHHTILHFPIALLTTAALAHVLALVHRWHGWRITGGVALLLGTAATIVAVISGVLAQERALAGGIPAAVINLHLTAAIITLSVAVVTMVAWIAFATRRQLSVTGPAALIAALTVVTAGAVSVTGHLGGSMLHPGIAPLPEVRDLASVSSPAQAENVDPEAAVAEAPTTEVDVEAGAAIYAEACASCHGDDGEGIAAMGAPAVFGEEALPVDPPPDADRERSFDTGEDVLAYVRETMPLDDPGALSDGDYREAVRYILHRHGLEVPPELSDDAAREIAIPAR